MDKNDLQQILKKFQDGKLDINETVNSICEKTFEDMGFAAIDYERELRVGYPETIYCKGKTVLQVQKIVESMLKKENNILATRANIEMYTAVKKVCPDAEYNELGRIITIRRHKMQLTESYIAIVAAGTSDLPVVEEAAETASLFGNRVERVIDVGVAGIHRLFAKMDIIRKAKVIIVVAGMEGALASVVGGLVDKPVIAVPTSIGYGANFGGLSALLCMLNSCASGVSVVNIDNGFGAAYAASMINKL